MASFSTTLKTSWLLCLGLVILALLAPKQADAHMAMLYPTPRGGYGTKDFDGRIHVFIDYQGFKFPCGGYPKGPTTSTPLDSLIHSRQPTDSLNLSIPPWIIVLTKPISIFSPFFYFEQN